MLKCDIICFPVYPSYVVAFYAIHVVFSVKRLEIFFFYINGTRSNNLIVLNKSHRKSKIHLCYRTHHFYLQLQILSGLSPRASSEFRITCGNHNSDQSFQSKTLMYWFHLLIQFDLFMV